MLTSLTRPAEVLVIDDDPAVRGCLTHLLEREGRTVATACDGRQALDYLRSNPPPRLILLDLTMPAMDGREFLIRRQQVPALREVPVVAFSACIDWDAACPLDLGAAESLYKPFDLPKLLEVTRRYCAAPAPAV
jgi:CheY-like chemotaxis protein